MALKIRASVVDIRVDTPSCQDKFILDTNIWLFLFYPPVSANSVSGHLQQAIDYPDYINKALAAHATLFSTGLEFSEVSHNIEKTERAIYNSQLAVELSPKKFRHDYPSARHKVNTLVQNVWNDITSVSTLLGINLDDNFIKEVSAFFPSVAMDGYDAIMAKAALKSGIVQIVTDDSDFATVPGLTIFTANSKVISEAQVCRKLITR